MRHRPTLAEWKSWRQAGFVARDFGFDDATNGLGQAEVVRPQGSRSEKLFRHRGELLFLFPLQGNVVIRVDGGGTYAMESADPCVVPSGMEFQLADPSDDFQFLLVTIPPDAFSRTSEIERIM